MREIGRPPCYWYVVDDRLHAGFLSFYQSQVQSLHWFPMSICHCQSLAYLDETCWLDILVKSCQSCRCMQGKSHKACRINIEILNIWRVSSCLHQFAPRAWQTNFRFVRLCFMFQSKSRRRQPSASFQLISRLRNWNIDERLRSIWYDSSHQLLKVWHVSEKKIQRFEPETVRDSSIIVLWTFSLWY